MAQQEMNSSLSIAVLAAGIVMVATVSVHAGGRGSGHPDADKYKWRQVADEMSVSEYRSIYRHNKRVLRSAVKLYSETVVESMGLPEKARELVGATAGLATNLLSNHDLRFRLNDIKTFALEVRDPAENDRALFLNYRLKW